MGVSARTVSRVVNGEAVVSRATRDRVLEAIDQLGYRPNLLARGLINQRSGMIALMVTSMANPFFPEFADGVRAAATDHGLTLVLTSSEDEAAAQERLLRDLASHSVEGLIAFSAFDGHDSLAEAARGGLPVVVVNERSTDPDVLSVRADMCHGAQLAVEHLVGIGRSRVGMVAGELDESHPRWREHGFRSACAEHDLGCRSICTEAATIDGGDAATKTLLEQHPDLDGIFAYNDLMAIGAIRALERSGRNVPHDVAVVGFDDITIGAFVTPALTTIRIDRYKLGRLAVDTLVDVRAGNRPVPPLLDVELIPRVSA